MRRIRLFTPLLALLLLTGCTRPGLETPPAAITELGEDGQPSKTLCRIVDGADIGELVLASEEGVYTLSTASVGEPPQGLQDGMVVEVFHNGLLLETWPEQFGEVYSLTVQDEPVDDRCGLYLQVLEELWEKDPGLNGGLSYLGMDLSGLTHLTEMERAALAWRFGANHGLELLTGSFDELAEQGYIDKENLVWEDGLLFTLETDEEAAWSLPNLAPGEEPPGLTAFHAQKWRSGLGAYSMEVCGRRQEGGSWTYTVTGEAIA